MKYSMKLRVVILSLMALMIGLVASMNVANAEIVPPDIKKTVIFIFLSDANGNLARNPKTNAPLANGTGFIVALNDAPRSGVFGYLVTAKHVLKDAKGNYYPRVYLGLNRIEGDVEYKPLDLVGNTAPIIYTHPDPTVDIAVVAVMPSDSVYDFKAIPAEMISTKETLATFHVSEGTEVFFEGLFTQYIGDHKNIPIVRFGRVAMFPDQPILFSDAYGGPPQIQQLYLFETQSYGGNSGSPVFITDASDRWRDNVLTLGPAAVKLVGIMHGRFNEDSPSIGTVEMTSSISPVIVPNIGIAAITPSYFLHDILFSDKLREFRASHPILDVQK